MRILWILLQGLPGGIDLLRYLECNEWTDDRTTTLKYQLKDFTNFGGFFKHGIETHHALLEAGIWIIQGLNLCKVTPGIYELVCLPLKIEGSDGAPSRAILRLVVAA